MQMRIYEKLTCLRRPLRSILTEDKSRGQSSFWDTPCICALAYFSTALPYALNCFTSFCQPLPCRPLTCSCGKQVTTTVNRPNEAREQVEMPQQTFIQCINISLEIITH